MLLEESKIPCRLDFAPVTSNDPVLGASPGETKLLVDEEHVDAAVEVLSRALEEADDAPLEFDWEAEGFGEQDDS